MRFRFEGTRFQVSEGSRMSCSRNAFASRAGVVALPEHRGAGALVRLAHRERALWTPALCVCMSTQSPAPEPFKKSYIQKSYIPGARGPAPRSSPPGSARLPTSTLSGYGPSSDWQPWPTHVGITAYESAVMPMLWDLRAGARIHLVQKSYITVAELAERLRAFTAGSAFTDRLGCLRGQLLLYTSHEFLGTNFLQFSMCPFPGSAFALFAAMSGSIGVVSRTNCAAQISS